MILDGLLRIPSFEEKVSHRDKGEGILLVDLKCLAEHLSRLIELLSIEVEYSKLSKSLEVIGIPVQDFLEVRDGSIFVFRVLLKGLTESKMGVDGISVDLDGMFEVFSCTLPLSQIGKEVGKMDACTKVIVIDRKALLEVLHACLKVFHLLLAHTDVVKRVGFRWALVWIINRSLDTLL